MDQLSKLPNIGNTVEAQLNQAGIFTEEELKQIGAEQAWLKIQQIDESACINQTISIRRCYSGN